MSKTYRISLIMKDSEGQTVTKEYDRMTMRRLRLVASEYDATHSVVSMFAQTEDVT